MTTLLLFIICVVGLALLFVEFEKPVEVGLVALTIVLALTVALV